MSIYHDIMALGVKTSNYQSDFYFEKTPETEEVVKKYYKLPDSRINSFISNVENTPWFCAHFEYIPYWKAKEKISYIPKKEVDQKNK